MAMEVDEIDKIRRMQVEERNLPPSGESVLLFNDQKVTGLQVEEPLLALVLFAGINTPTTVDETNDEAFPP